MQDLIRITHDTIGADVLPTVSARDLHKALGIESDFMEWIGATLHYSDYEDDVDYMGVGIERGIHDYILHLGAAKGIAFFSRRSPHYDKVLDCLNHYAHIANPKLTDDQGKIAKKIQRIRAETSPSVQLFLLCDLEQYCRKRGQSLPPIVEIVTPGQV